MIDKDAPKDVWQLAKDWPLAFEFKLPDNAKVVIAGAYKGLAIELLRDLYPTCNIFGFEPQDWAVNEAAARLHAMKDRSNWWQIEPYGLGTMDAYLPMGEYHTDAASFINTGSREQGHGYVKEFGKTMAKTGLDHLDLFVLNVEGMEWELLPHIIEIGWLEKIDRLAVQFHLGMGNEIAGLLPMIDQTHNRLVDNFPTWILWKKS